MVFIFPGLRSQASVPHDKMNGSAPVYGSEVLHYGSSTELPTGSSTELPGALQDDVYGLEPNHIELSCMDPPGQLLFYSRSVMSFYYANYAHLLCSYSADCFSTLHSKCKAILWRGLLL